MSITTATVGSTTRTIAPSVMRRSWRISGRLDGGDACASAWRWSRSSCAVANELALARA